MRCVYCCIAVVGHREVMTVPGLGAAHSTCHINHQFQQRIFRGIDIAMLGDSDLAVLEELVKTERNQRSKSSLEPMDFELF